MFVKLLKYEWRSSRRLVGLICALIGLSGVLSGGAVRSLVWSFSRGYAGMVPVYTTVLVVAAITIPICCAVSMYALMYRFYNSRFTDQGYLLLTLPVSTHQQMLSCVVNTVIGVSLVSIVALISGLVALSTFWSLLTQDGIKELTNQLRLAGTEVVGKLGIGSGSVLLLIPYGLITFLADILLFMAALTVGAQVGKHPVLYGVVTYIGVNELASLATDLMDKWIQNPTVTTLASCLLYAILGAAAYFVTYYILDKRLNLT